MSKVSVSGITIGYDDLGSGPPLVLVHGHPFDRSMWQPQAEHFASAGLRVIVMDLRGYGESTVVPGRTLLETFARDIAGLLDQLGVGRVLLGGLSMGGQIVLEFQRLFPHRPHGLLLADTSPRADTEDVKKQRNEVADRLLHEGMGPYAEATLPRMVSRHTLRTLPEVARHVHRMMYDTPPEGAAAALRGRAERPDYVGMLARIAVPTLVAVGREDEFTPVEEARFIQESIPGASLAVIEKTGHLPNLERREEFNAALRAFLTSAGDPRLQPYGKALATR